MAVGIIGTTP